MKRSQVESVRVGQRLILAGIGLNLVFLIANVMRGGEDPASALAFVMLGSALGGAILAILGIWRLGSGLDYGAVSRVLLILGSFVPLVSLIILFVLSGKATAILRDRGYSVGLLGAAPKSS
jgi:MFS-type transporter involved in bile tolerance (Atg22 family)